MIRSVAATLMLCLLAAPALAGGWTVAAEKSALNVFSLKNDEIAEQHAFTQLSGTVAEDGAAAIDVSLASIDSGIEIRDQRMRDMLFQVADWPLARITARTEPAAFEALSPGQARQVELNLTVDANGESADYPAQLVVPRLREASVAVSPQEPLLVRAGDFGYGDGIDALREVAGLDAISPTVPVVFVLVLER